MVKKKRLLLYSLLHHSKDTIKNYSYFTFDKFREIVTLDSFELRYVNFLETYMKQYSRAPSYEIVTELPEVFTAEDFVDLRLMGELSPLFGVDFQFLLDNVYKFYYPTFLKRLIEKNSSSTVSKMSSDIVQAVVKFSLDQGRDTFFIDEEAKAEAKNYTKRVNTVGILTGLSDLDLVFHGFKSKRLYIFGAFTSHGKSTLMINFHYNAIVSGYNSVFISLEMDKSQVEHSLYSIHSNSDVWKGAEVPLTCDKIQNSQFTSAEEDFYVNYVIRDFSSNSSYGRGIIVVPCESVSPAYLCRKITEINLMFPVDIVFVDYVARMVPDYSVRDKRMDTNSIITSLKRLAMNFNEGRGTSLCTAAQVNRKSYTSYEENGGYDLTCLGEYNALEQDADFVATCYVSDEMRQINEAEMQVLKQRDGRVLYDPFRVYLNFSTKKLGSLGE